MEPRHHRGVRCRAWLTASSSPALHKPWDEPSNAARDEKPEIKVTAQLGRGPTQANTLGEMKNAVCDEGHAKAQHQQSKHKWPAGCATNTLNQCRTSGDSCHCSEY